MRRKYKAKKIKVKVKPYAYQPSRAELDAKINVSGTTPKEMARLLRKVKFIDEDEP